MHHKDHSGHQLVCTFNTCVRGNTSPDQQEALVCTQCVCVCVYLLRKEFPNALSFLKGFLGSTTRALPGMTPSFSPYITAMKPSVVGSGPIRIPGKSCSNRYLRRERERGGQRSLCLCRFIWTSSTSHTVSLVKEKWERKEEMEGGCSESLSSHFLSSQKDLDFKEKTDRAGKLPTTRQTASPPSLWARRTDLVLSDSDWVKQQLWPPSEAKQPRPTGEPGQNSTRTQRLV